MKTTKLLGAELIISRGGEVQIVHGARFASVNDFDLDRPSFIGSPDFATADAKYKIENTC